MTPPSVLLVEDDEDRVLLTRRALDEAGVDPEVEVAGTGEEALEKLAEGSVPDLVLLDLKLPGLDGFGVLERLAEDTATPPVPTVVLTSSDETQDMIRSYELGANGFVTKPVDFDEFREVVQHIARFWLEINTSPARGER